jgi:hypothetical protein
MALNWPIASSPRDDIPCTYARTPGTTCNALWAFNTLRCRLVYSFEVSSSSNEELIDNNITDDMIGCVVLPRHSVTIAEIF